ncbi:MAG: glycosyltransferase, partial [Bacteroidota bacterium]
WEPVVYTPEGGEQPAYDESLLQEVPNDIEIVKTNIWEPYSLYKKFTGKKADKKIYSGFISEGKKSNWTQDVSVFIRGNFFIPDARKFWIKPSIKFLKNYLNDHPVDAIISTGPPHSMHMIALGVKKYHNIPWIADFRDPWTQIDFYDQLKLTKLGDRKHKRMEQQVLKEADKIVAIGWNMIKDFQKITDRSLEDMLIVTNGYDQADFESPAKVRTKDFVICHLGSMNKDRNPRMLWKVLGDKVKADVAFAEKLKIVLIGNVDQSIVEALHENGLKDQLDLRGFMPHKEVIEYMKTVQVLLLPINDTPNAMAILPGKLFEYMGAKRPIIGIGPEGDSDAARVLNLTGAGSMHHYQDEEGIRNRVEELYNTYKNGSLEVDSNGIEQFSRRQLAGQFADILNKL